VGVAIAPDHGNDPGRLLRSADLALNKAKRSERVHCHIFVHDLDAELDQRLTLEHKIQGALVGDGFTLHFQPQFATDRKLTGFEALLRLPTGDGDYIPPATFIPLIEKSGLIDRVGAWVLGKACATAAVWPDHLSVAVNLSPAQFSVGNVGDAITRALNDSGLRPERLEIEITESLLMHDTEAVLAELAAIKELGVSIVMDDFGTGYSSLGYLWRFPFDKIKVDKSFMSALDAADANAEKIVRTIIGLGRSLKMRVTVEGVENERQADFVRALGCDEIQGFLFGHPAPITEVAGIILDDYRARTPLAERDESRRVAIG
jgi:EAL domain-containing protein (putative c-di-GMP-specific phosphodiesterase class I)